MNTTTGARTSEVVVVFRAPTREHVIAAATALLMIPALSEQSMLSAEFSYSSRARAICVRLHFDRDRFNDRARRRIAFWCTRAGGALPSEGSGPPPSPAVAASDADPSRFAAAVGRMCTATGHEVALPPPLAPLLTVDVSGPATAGISYDAARRRLFVPCPVAPPVGDSLMLEVVSPPPGRERIRGFVRVDEVRPPAAASPGRAAGFSLALESGGTPVHAVLVAALPPDGSDKRAAPRLRTTAPVRLQPAPTAGTRSPPTPAAPAYLRDISVRGAFIRTPEPKSVGSRVRVSMRLLDSVDFETVATVAHVATDGMGVQFRLDAYGEARLAEAFTAMTGRPLRVLVVDDDALARRMLRDAFEGRGFAVLTAPDAELGLHVLAEEILALDALVTDARMPGVDGEEFVRRIRGAGGEHDLPIVVATATLDDCLAKRLQAAGANRAVEKSSGPELIVDATVAEISAYGRCAGAPVAVSAA